MNTFISRIVSLFLVVTLEPPLRSGLEVPSWKKQAAIDLNPYVEIWVAVWKEAEHTRNRVPSILRIK